MTGQQLKNSILQMAVQGKLVPQDPNDEPASVLLERIRAEKEKLIKEGKIKKEKNPSVIFRGADNLPYEKIGKNDPVCIADEVPFEIPESWEWCRIGELFFLQAGKNISSSSISEKPFANAIPCYGGNGIRGYVKSSNRSGDYPIIGRQGALCGNINRATGDFYATEHAVCVTTFSNTNVSWACVFLKALNLNQYATATAQPGLAVGTINRVLIPVPPVTEQRRITEKLYLLEPLLASYESTHDLIINQQHDFPEQLKKSILQEAVQGKLVSQDPTDEPASVLLERICAEKEQLIKSGKIKRDKHESVIFRRDNSYYERVDGIERCIDDEIPFEIPDNWCWARIKSCIDVRDGTHDTPKYVEHGIPLITSKNLSNGYLDFSTAKLISLEDHLSIKQRSKVDDGDILFAMIGSIGNPVLYHGNQEFSIKNMALFKKITNNISMDYAYIFFEYAQTYMKKDATGGVQAFVSLNYLRNYLIPIPPQKEQIRIYNAVTQLHKKIDYMA